MPIRLLLLFALLLAAPTAGADVAPVERTPFHIPIFRNESGILLDVLVPGRRAAPYHRHVRDFVFVVVRESPLVVQNLGDPTSVAIDWPRGFVGYGAFSRKELTHRAENVGDAAARLVGFEFTEPGPKGRRVSARPAIYEQIIDNERLRGWRVVLPPGAVAPGYERSAPGLRIVVEGGALVETREDGARQDMALEPGDFQWRDDGPAPALGNEGGTTIHLVEFELK